MARAFHVSQETEDDDVFKKAAEEAGGVTGGGNACNGVTDPEETCANVLAFCASTEQFQRQCPVTCDTCNKGINAPVTNATTVDGGDTGGVDGDELDGSGGGGDEDGGEPDDETLEGGDSVIVANSTDPTGPAPASGLGLPFGTVVLVGIIVGGVVFIAGLAVLIVCCCKRRGSTSSAGASRGGGGARGARGGGRAGRHKKMPPARTKSSKNAPRAARGAGGRAGRRSVKGASENSTETDSIPLSTLAATEYNQNAADELYGAGAEAGGDARPPMPAPSPAAEGDGYLGIGGADESQDARGAVPPPMPQRPTNTSFRRQVAEFQNAPDGFEVDDDDQPPAPPPKESTMQDDAGAAEPGYINSKQAVADALAEAGSDYNPPPPIPPGAGAPPIPMRGGSMKGTSLNGGNGYVNEEMINGLLSSTATSPSSDDDSAYNAVFYHGAVTRTVAEERLKESGRYRFLLRTSNGSTVLSYTAGNLRDLVHLKISEDAEKGTFMINGTPIAASKSVGMTFAGAIDAVLSEAAIKLGKKLFPVRNPALGPGDGAAHAEMDERGYVNTSWATMARYLGELPATDRGEAEKQLKDRGIDGGFLLRQNGEPSAYKASVSCYSGGKFEHCIISLVEDPDKKGAKWVFQGIPQDEVTMLEVATRILKEDKLIPNACWVGSERRPHPGNFI